VTNTSAIPMTVDGVRLDTYAYNIETLAGRLTVPGVRGSNVTVPGQDGSVFTANKDWDDGNMVLKMWVRGCDVNGAVPVMSSQMAEFRSNLAALSTMFGVRHRLLDIRQTWPAGDIQWMSEVRDAYDLSATAVNPKASFAVNLEVPGVFGQDVSTSDYTSAGGLAPAVTLTLATYSGLTAPINDAILVVRGPATNPRLTNVDTGEWVQLNATIGTGTDWRIDCGLWTTITGSAIGLSGTTGTNQVVNTTFAGGGARFLRLTPKSGGPQIRLDGTSFNTTTQVLARAKRKYLL